MRNFATITISTAVSSPLNRSVIQNTSLIIDQKDIRSCFHKINVYPKQQLVIQNIYKNILRKLS